MPVRRTRCCSRAGCLRPRRGERLHAGAEPRPATCPASRIGATISGVKARACLSFAGALVFGLTLGCQASVNANAEEIWLAGFLVATLLIAGLFNPVLLGEFNLLNLLRQVSYQGQREDKPARQVVRPVPHPSRR